MIARDGEVASVVVIAEVVGIIVERQITKTTPEGETGIDTAIFKPVNTWLYLIIKHCAMVKSWEAILLQLQSKFQGFLES